jgi:hypothetical protein
MPRRYLVGRRSATDSQRVDVYGTVDADDVAQATFAARDRWPSDDVGVMTPEAVERWMRRGASLNEARNLASGSDK